MNKFHCNSSELFTLSFKIVFRCLSIWIEGPDKRIDINIFKYRDCCLCRLVAMVGGEWTDTADSSKADWSFYRYCADYGRLIYRYGPLIGISTSSVLICVCCVLMTSYACTFELHCSEPSSAKCSMFEFNRQSDLSRYWLWGFVRQEKMPSVAIKHSSFRPDISWYRM